MQLMTHELMFLWDLDFNIKNSVSNKKWKVAYQIFINSYVATNFLTSCPTVLLYTFWNAYYVILHVYGSNDYSKLIALHTPPTHHVWGIVG